MRFLGRKVYLGAVTVLAAALQDGPTKKRVVELEALLGVSRRTLVRWRRWWTSIFVASRFWTSLRGSLVPSVDEATMPASLLSRAVKIPVIGIGGIATAEDAVEFMLAGATAVQVGTASFADPLAAKKVKDGLARYCEERGVAARELIGKMIA